MADFWGPPSSLSISDDGGRKMPAGTPALLGMAERVGFEPTVPVLPGHSLSRRALSTAQTPLRGSMTRLSEAWMGLNLGVGRAPTSSGASIEFEFWRWSRGHRQECV